MGSTWVGTGHPRCQVAVPAPTIVSWAALPMFKSEAGDGAGQESTGRHWGGLGLPASVSPCAKQSCIVFADAEESTEHLVKKGAAVRPRGPGELPKRGCRQRW